MILLFLYKIDKHYIYLEICGLNSKPLSQPWIHYHYYILQDLNSKFFKCLTLIFYNKANIRMVHKIKINYLVNAFSFRDIGFEQ